MNDLKNAFNGQDIMVLSSSEKIKNTLSSPTLEDVEYYDKQLLQHFHKKFVIEARLSRSVVSFQANKARPIYRWYKYKEAFSASLVEYLFSRYKITTGKILDPFAGIGTALFVASSAGIDADGIELLPIGQQIVKVKECLENGFVAEDLVTLKQWSKTHPWRNINKRCPLTVLRITNDAYPEQTLESIERYLGAMQQENERVQSILLFALLCILESVSYTRRDGQYLRWDYRSGRQQGKKPFDKGRILDFEQAISAKLDEILFDLSADGQIQMELFSSKQKKGAIHLYNGSCLELMPTLPDSYYDAIITSPPYCNRYDYTRTYALELALLGIGEKEIAELRQHMLSCTVENRSKDLLKINPQWTDALAVADHETLLQTILHYLENQKAKGLLNNQGIPRMVRGYFYEMACVIFECARVMKSGALLFMINDNVRYAGASISVDMILSHIAEQSGFCIENILVLPNDKGNSSQQMGKHGRIPMRKCVYVWRKL